MGDPSPGPKVLAENNGDNLFHCFDGTWLGTVLVSSPATDKTWEQTSADSSPSLESPDLSALECIEEEELSEVPSPGWSL